MEIRNNRRTEKYPTKTVLKIVVIVTIGMGIISTFAKPELTILWLGLAGSALSYLAGIPQSFLKKRKGDS